MLERIGNTTADLGNSDQHPGGTLDGFPWRSRILLAVPVDPPFVEPGLILSPVAKEPFSALGLPCEKVLWFVV
jgi:hypothetical protein